MPKAARRDAFVLRQAQDRGRKAIAGPTVYMRRRSNVRDILAGLAQNRRRDGGERARGAVAGNSDVGMVEQRQDRGKR